MAINSLPLAPFNMHRYNCGQLMLQSLLDVLGIVVRREHWLSKFNFGMLQVNENYEMLALSAMSDNLSNDILRGRPFGGILIMCRRY